MLKASYGEISKILTKKNIFRYAFNIGVASSVKLSKRLGGSAVLLVFFWNNKLCDWNRHG